MSGKQRYSGISFSCPLSGPQTEKEPMSVGKHDRDKDQDGQVPQDKSLPNGDWIKTSADVDDDEQARQAYCTTGCWRS